MKYFRNKLAGKHFLLAIQITSMLYWLVWMKDSDSYYILYLIVGMAGIVSCYDNTKNEITLKKIMGGV